MTRPLVLGVLLFALSGPSAAASVQVTFEGGGTMTAEALEFRDGLAILTLPGGGLLAVSAKRVLEVREIAASAPEPRGPQGGPSSAPSPPAGDAARPASPAALAPAERPSIETLIRQASLKYALDAELLRCLIEVESGYDPLAVSPKGAMGLGQLMPGTAKDLGVEDPFDPAQSVDAAARHLSDLLQRSDGRFVPALAAYNAGQGAVKRWGGLPPYRETIHYIEKILSRYATP